MSENPSVWEVRLGIYATQQQAEEVKEHITRLLCPDPGHAPPCPIPWSVSLRHGPEPGSGSGSEADDSYAELIEQAEAEKHLRP
ncbi:hypothetical protein ACF08M_35680 [Streptomyces sp. NPDC015032]|uniref:hypothetical protein n=1 Tax=Streptomyces sp. NPDC015032 TaxID=3364937 RepID=UPI0036F93AB3